jgi:hypothetical protein
MEAVWRAERLTDEAQMRLPGGAPGLAVVAGLAGRDDVLPIVATASTAGNYVIQGKILGR